MSGGTVPTLEIRDRVRDSLGWDLPVESTPVLKTREGDVVPQRDKDLGEKRRASKKIRRHERWGSFSSFSLDTELSLATASGLGPAPSNRGAQYPVGERFPHGDVDVDELMNGLEASHGGRNFSHHAAGRTRPDHDRRSDWRAQGLSDSLSGQKEQHLEDIDISSRNFISGKHQPIQQQKSQGTHVRGSLGSFHQNSIMAFSTPLARHQPAQKKKSMSGSSNLHYSGSSIPFSTHTFSHNRLRLSSPASAAPPLVRPSRPGSASRSFHHRPSTFGSLPPSEDVFAANYRPPRSHSGSRERAASIDKPVLEEESTSFGLKLSGVGSQGAASEGISDPVLPRLGKSFHKELLPLSGDFYQNIAQSTPKRGRDHHDQDSDRISEVSLNLLDEDILNAFAGPYASTPLPLSTASNPRARVRDRDEFNLIEKPGDSNLKANANENENGILTASAPDLASPASIIDKDVPSLGHAKVNPVALGTGIGGAHLGLGTLTRGRATNDVQDERLLSGKKTKKEARGAKSRQNPSRRVRADTKEDRAHTAGDDESMDELLGPSLRRGTDGAAGSKKAESGKRGRGRGPRTATTRRTRSARCAIVEDELEDCVLEKLDEERRERIEYFEKVDKYEIWKENVWVV
ncbi:hypothetical protein SISNIDRAFT_470670 [Sistotremastrum niveocremeum HHB9708]|uniref:Uncharacterized protein n=1 Tax=Sistotremastrum niveocremeum HHB9708 TaxID=1314777 RepID=A0A164NJQ2_9AGAM|nr:hypothetical protein SISNIDRAFT_470670 [Sistotremastrum niveocremeum HHB9708]